MEHKHTPGPWRIKNHKGKYRVIKEEDIVLMAYAAKTIADISQSDDEGKANAKLIAAAPKLLEHLTALLIVAEASGITGESIEDAKRLIKNINS